MPLTGKGERRQACPRHGTQKPGARQRSDLGRRMAGRSRLNYVNFPQADLLSPDRRVVNVGRCRLRPIVRHHPRFRRCCHRNSDPSGIKKS